MMKLHPQLTQEGRTFKLRSLCGQPCLRTCVLKTSVLLVTSLENGDFGKFNEPLPYFDFFGCDCGHCGRNVDAAMRNVVERDMRIVEVV